MASFRELTAPAKNRALGLMQLGAGAAERAGLINEKTAIPGTNLTYGDFKSSQDDVVDQLRSERESLGLIGDIGLDPLTYLPIKGGFVTTGAKGGGLSGLTDATKTNESRLANTAKGAAFGAGAGAVLKTGGKIAGKSVKGGEKIVKGLTSLFGSDDANKLVSGLEVSLAKEGLDAAGIQAAVKTAGKTAMKEYKKAVRSGLNPTQAKVMAIAKANNIPISAPAIMQDAGGQAMQGAARVGMLGDDAQKVALENQAAVSQGLKNYLRNVVRQIAGDDLERIDFTSASQAASDTVYQGVKAAKSKVDELYNAAREAGKKAFIDVKDFAPLRKEMAGVVNDMQIDTSLSPALRANLRYFRDNILKRAQKHGGKVSWTEVSNFRKRLTANSGAPGSPEAVAISRIKTVFDKFNDELSAGGKIIGDDTALESIRSANKAFKDYKTSYWGADGDGVAGKLYDSLTGKAGAGRIEPEQFLQKMLGIGGKGNFTNVKAAKQIRMLKQAFGDSPEIMGKARGIVLQNILKSTLTDEAADVSGDAFRKNLSEALRQNSAGMRELFGDNFVNALKDAADVAFYATNVVRDKANPSGSASVLGAVGKTILDAMPGANQTMAVVKSVAKPIATANQARTVEKGITAPLKQTPSAAIEGLKNSKASKFINGALKAAPGVAADKSMREYQQPTAKPNRYEGLTDADLQKLYERKTQRLKQSLEVPQSLIEDEGVRNESYTDTTGNKTVGLGFNMDSSHSKGVWEAAGIGKDFDAVYEGKEKLSATEIKSLANASYQIAENDARSFMPDFDKLSDARRDALTNLSFQLGANNLAEFKGFKTALLNGEYSKAAQNLINSKWWKQTQPSRRNRIVKQILAG